MAFGFEKLFKSGPQKVETNQPKERRFEMQEFAEPKSQSNLRMLETNGKIEVWLGSRIKYTSNDGAPGSHSLQAKSAEFKPDEKEKARAFYMQVQQALVETAAGPGDPDAVFETAGKLFPEKEAA